MLKRIALFILLSSVSCSASPKVAKHQFGLTINNSGVGINSSLSPNNNDEIAFLNIFKHMTGWQPYLMAEGATDLGYTGETWYLYKTLLDSNGYPTSLSGSNSTFTATISDGAGGAGTIVNVTALGTGPGPWNGGTISGTGVTGGTVMTVPTPFAKFNATFSGTSMTINAYNNVGPVTPGMLVSIPTGGTAHVLHCPTSDTLAHCSATGVYTLDTSISTGTTNFVIAQQVEGTTGYYISSNSLNLGPRTITEMQRFDSLRAEAVLGTCQYSCYPAGNGAWELVYNEAANPVSSNFTYHTQHNLTQASHNCTGGTCTDVLNVTNAPGFKLELTTVDASNPVKNIRLCRVGVSSTTACENGTEYFNPDWIAQMKSFRTVRTMDWNQTNNNQTQIWTGRTPIGWVTWQDNTANTDPYTGGGSFGFGGYNAASPLGYNNDVPIEAEVALANELHSNLWLNLPCMADGSFQTGAANYVLSNLHAGSKVYVEICNEFFNNPGLGAVVAPFLYGTMASAGYVDSSTSCGFGNGTGCIYDEYIFQVARTSTAWRSVWTGGNASRLKIILGGQYSFTQVNSNNLTATGTWSGTLATQVDVLGTAPYWPCCIGLYPPRSWSADADDGVGKMYSDLSSGALKPSFPTAGNCGNGAGFSCTPVDTAHFVVSTGYAGYTPGCGGSCGDPTYLQQGLINDTCISFITKAASTGSPPNLNVDSGGSLPLSGSLNNNELYLTCYQNGVWNIQRSEPLGNCGNGVSFTCAGSDSSHFLLTTGESLADPPPNGKCIFLNNTISPGAAPIFLKTDGGTYYQILATPQGNLFDTGQQAFCFLNQDVNGAVSPALWERVSPWLQCGPDFLCAATFTARDVYVATNATSSVALYGYEGGQQITDPGTTITRQMVLDFVKSSQFGSLYQQYLTDLKNAGMIEEQLYSEPRSWSQGNWWGFNPGTYAYTNNVTSVIHRQQAIYSWIASNPCWWAGCTVH